MKDETKEELDDLLIKNQNKLLLDCIINLQKENGKLKHSLWEQQEKNEYLRDKLDYITNLQEEKRKLKAELELYKDNHNYLNDKIDKAIEYIKEHACYDKECNMCCDDLWTSGCDEVIEILQGKSDE